MELEIIIRAFEDKLAKQEKVIEELIRSNDDYRFQTQSLRDELKLLKDSINMLPNASPGRPNILIHTSIVGGAKGSLHVSHMVDEHMIRMSRNPEEYLIRNMYESSHALAREYFAFK